MSEPSITVVMPVFNELATLRTSLDRLLAVELPIERTVMVVDDGSTDGCLDTIEDLVASGQVTLIQQPTNQGKGAALRRGIQEADTDLLTILDADLEYDPVDFVPMIEAVLEEGARVVYGKRSFGGHAAYSFWYVLGNKGLAFWTSFLYDAWLSDIETCLKIAPVELWREVGLKSSGFGIEAEVTGKFLKGGERIFEVPITYRARGREEGKKLHWTDGVEAMWILLRIRLLGR
jgi:glycosyltransferase involved in cell wall biosynthesis